MYLYLSIRVRVRRYIDMQIYVGGNSSEVEHYFYRGPGEFRIRISPPAATDDPSFVTCTATTIRNYSLRTLL